MFDRLGERGYDVLMLHHAEAILHQDMGTAAALAAMSVRPFIKRHRYRENTLKVAVRLLRSLETMRHIVGDRNACEFGSQFGLARLKANEQTGQADGS